MTRLGSASLPGHGAAVFTSEREILFDGRNSEIQNSVISSAAVDAGMTPTTTLRRGLLLGKITASNKFKQWDAAATDGSQIVAGVLPFEISTADYDGTAADRVTGTWNRGMFYASQLLIQGVALVGHTDEYLARRQLRALMSILDDDRFNLKAGQPRTVVKTADYTVVADDNGTRFTTRGAAGAVNFTLPTLQRGLEFSFFAEANQTLKVTAAVAGTLVVFNDAAANTIDFETSNEIIGGAFTVRANDDASKWLVEVSLGAETQTPTITT
jgi:hypothetical protein